MTSSVQFSCSVLSDSVTPLMAACQASLSISNSQSLLKLMSIKSVMSSNHLILCHPLFLLSSVFPSIIWITVLYTQWTQYWKSAILQFLSMWINGHLRIDAIQCRYGKQNQLNAKRKITTCVGFLSVPPRLPMPPPSPRGNHFWVFGFIFFSST